MVCSTGRNVTNWDAAMWHAAQKHGCFQPEERWVCTRRVQRRLGSPRTRICRHQEITTSRLTEFLRSAKPVSMQCLVTEAVWGRCNILLLKSFRTVRFHTLFGGGKEGCRVVCNSGIIQNHESFIVIEDAPLQS